MRNKKRRNLRDLALGKGQPQSDQFPYRGVYAYLHTDHVPTELMSFYVVHSFHNMSEGNMEDFTCTVEEYIQRVKKGDIKGWGMCAVPSGYDCFDGVLLDYAMVDSHNKGNVFLPSPVIGDLWEYFRKSPHSIPDQENAFSPYLSLYIFDYL